jgi:propanol-preferring alcohol dehydrogenase
MQAWILEEQAQIEQRPLKLVEILTPHAKDDEVRIKLEVCGVCRTDIHIAEGDLPLNKTPIILGHEAVGIVDEVGKSVQRFKVGDKAGVYWLHNSCGVCKYCLSQRENYCPEYKATGWDEHGGFAEYMTVPAENALPLNDVQLEPADIAPLLCPGVAGYAAFKLTGVQRGDRLGLYGFGPTAHYVLKVAQYLGIETYVSTRSVKNTERAIREGSNWVADVSSKPPPCNLDAVIIFPAAGNLVELSLSHLEKGGTLVMAPVSSSQIVIENYSENFWGRSIKTLYNVTKSDAEGFIKVLFPFEELPEALIQLKHGKLEQPNAIIKVA